PECLRASRRAHASADGLGADVVVEPTGKARSPGYRHIESLLGAEQCVILDGDVETELQRLSGRTPNQEMWGTGALYQAPETVLDVHSGHLAAGCNVLSTAP